MKFAHLVIVILSIYLCGVSFLIDKLDKNSREYKNLLTSTNDTLEIWRDKDSISHARIATIQTENVKQFLQIQFQDSTIQKLQAEVKKYKKKLDEGGSVTIIEGETVYDTVIQKDSILVDHPVFDTINNKWIYSTFGFDMNKSYFFLKIKNQYSLVVGFEPQGFLKKKKPFSMITNYNPYTETTVLRTYQVSVPKPKRFGIGPGVMVTIDGKVVVGVSLNYTPVRF